MATFQQGGLNGFDIRLGHVAATAREGEISKAGATGGKMSREFTPHGLVQQRQRRLDQRADRGFHKKDVVNR